MVQKKRKKERKKERSKEVKKERWNDKEMKKYGNYNKNEIKTKEIDKKRDTIFLKKDKETKKSK